MTITREKTISAPLSSQQIMNMLPHHYPFLLLDRVIELDPGKYGKGIKNVTVNEPFFQGHFPHEPIMPGVLIIEALAQLTGIVFISEQMEDPEYSSQDFAGQIGYLASIKNIKFKNIIDRKSTRMNYINVYILYSVFCYNK